MALASVTASLTGTAVNPADWLKYLTPEYRTHFEEVGEDGVQFDVSNHRYSNPEKQFAALAWLKERRNQRTPRNTIPFPLLFWTALVTVIAAILALEAVALGETTTP
jgi:hypothetical protein